MLDEKQHAYRKKRSSLTQLLIFYDDILSELSLDQNVDVIYTDFAKYFDKVDIGILLHKVKHLGISGEIGEWLHSFLTN